MAKHNPSPNKPHRAVSKRLKLCTKCKKVWERAYQSQNIMYYDEFPTIGLVRETCEDCVRYS